MHISAAMASVAEEASPKEIEQACATPHQVPGTASTWGMLREALAPVQMWRELEGQAKEAVGQARALVPQAEAAECAAHSMRIQADVAAE